MKLFVKNIELLHVSAFARPSHGFVALSGEHTFIKKHNYSIAESLPEKSVLENVKLLLILKQKVKLIWTPSTSFLIHMLVSNAESSVAQSQFPCIH